MVLAAWFVLGYLGALLQRAGLAACGLAVLAHPAVPVAGVALAAPRVDRPGGGCLAAAGVVRPSATETSSPLTQPPVRGDPEHGGWVTPAAEIVSKGNELG